MPSQPQTNPVPGIWALGVLTVPASGAIPITTNVGTQQAGETDTGLRARMPQGRPFTSLVNQLVFSADGTNGSDVYINYGNYAGLDTNATVLIVPAGVAGVYSIPPRSTLVSGSIDPNQYYLSGGTPGDFVVATAIWAS